MIPSIDSTSRGSAGCDIGLSGMGILSTEFKHFHRRVVPGDPANRATSQCARATVKHIFVFRLDSPRADLVFALGKWKRQRIMKNVPVIHSQRILDVYGA